jgi:putative MFS transporter
LLVFLSVATFFEGYDVMALSQILPNLRADLGLSKATGGLLIASANAGAIAAWWLVRRADWWGRRRALGVTIAGYTLFTFATAFAGGALSSACCSSWRAPSCWPSGRSASSTLPRSFRPIAAVS